VIYPVPPQVQAAQPLEPWKVFQSRQVVVGQVNGIELITGDRHVFDGGYGERTQEDFARAKGVGPLFGRLDNVGGEAHFYTAFV